MSKLISQSLIRFNAQPYKRRILIAPLHSISHRSETTTSSQFLRFYSSTSSTSFASSSGGNNDDDKKKNDDWVLLYQRDSERNRLPQAAFAFSILNSSYWLWYTLDFIPTINASPIDDLYVNPMIGVGGVTFGLMINVVTGLYPYLLVSKLGYAPKNQELSVWKHDLFPFIQEAKEPKRYSLGTLRLNTSSSDTQNLLQDSSTYTGHLGLQADDERLPFLMEVREKGELRDPQLLLQLLLDPKAMSDGQEGDVGRSRNRGDRRKKQPKKKKKQPSAPEASKSSIEPINVKRRYAKKIKKR